MNRQKIRAYYIQCEEQLVTLLHWFHSITLANTTTFVYSAWMSEIEFVEVSRRARSATANTRLKYYVLLSRESIVIVIKIGRESSKVFTLDCMTACNAQ